MRRRLVASFVLLATASASADLASSYRAGDLATLRRTGGDDPGAVGRGLTADDRATVLGAIAAAEAAPDAWELLAPLATLAGGWDRSTAAPAARTAARISRGLDGDAAILFDVPDDRLAALSQAWGALAHRADRWSDVRVHALEVAARLAAARTATAAPPYDATAAADVLLAAAHADDLQLRRAAYELLPVPLPDGLRAPLAARLAAEDDVTVRLAAAQALCAALPADAAAVLAALGAPGLDAIRAALLAAEPRADVGPGAIVDAARCLAVDDDPRSVRALGRLRHAAPRPVRAVVARVVADVRARLREGAP